MRAVLSLTLLTTLFCACATGPSVPSGRPDVLPTVDTIPKAAPRILELAPGQITYDFRQSSEIRPESPIDTTYSSIVTEALFLVTITSQLDSTYEIVVSVDSVLIATSGSAPIHSQIIQSLPVSLGVVLRASLGPGSTDTEVVLPDSLCTYGQLASAAQEVTLFPLPYKAPLTNNGTWSDSAHFSTCRAGAIVETQTLYDIRYSVNQPNELVLQSVAIVNGAGVMRTDSVRVSGTVTSSGKALLEGDSRLPIFLESQSQGTITVQLGDSTTLFRQDVRREWRRRPPN